jgi:hypothetical protein
MTLRALLKSLALSYAQDMRRWPSRELSEPRDVSTCSLLERQHSCFFNKKIVSPLPLDLPRSVWDRRAREEGNDQLLFVTQLRTSLILSIVST